MNESIKNEPVRHVSTQAGYDAWAAIYDGDDNPLVKLEEPAVRAQLGDVTGLRLLDLGCGTGRHSIAFANAGAIVTAMDFSEGMLAKAREKSTTPIEFVSGDLHGRLPFEDGSFDRVICCLVFDHIRDSAHVLSEMRRVCRRDGRILVSVMHPAMLLAGVQARFTDEATGEKVLLASERNQVSDYVNASITAGLKMQSMSEHFVDDDLIQRSPRAEKYRGWPLLLLMILNHAD